MILAIDDDHIRDNGNVKSTAKERQSVKMSELFKTPALTAQTVALMVMTTVQIAGYFGMMNWLPTIIQTSLHISVKIPHFGWSQRFWECVWECSPSVKSSINGDQDLFIQSFF